MQLGVGREVVESANGCEDCQIVAAKLGDSVGQVFDGSERGSLALVYQGFGCGLLQAAHVAQAEAEGEMLADHYQAPALL